MRANIFILLMFLAIGCKNIVEKPEVTVLFPEKFWKNGNYILYDKYGIDINGDGQNDSVLIYKIENSYPPGEFHKVVIKYSSGKVIDINNHEDWVSIDRFKKREFRKYNLIPSDKLILTKISENKTVLIIFGFSYETYPGRFTVIDIDENNPKVLFFDKFDFMSIEDVNQDNQKELIGFNYYKKWFGICYRDSISVNDTYHPFFVLNYKNEIFQTDTNLSAEYNYENYLGYFGLETDERYSIIVPDPNAFNNYSAEFEPYFYFEKYRKYPFTSLKFLSESDLTGYSKNELRIIRNEIFAFHGYVFDSEDLKKHFESLDWYKPKDKNVAYRLNKYEKHNIQLIKELENKN